MLIKQVQFRGIGESGEVFCQPLLSHGFEKTAADASMRSKLHPKIKEFIGTVRPSSAGIYVLVNALGAGEYWGCFPAGTLIRTASGEEIPIEEICEGDEVITHKNRSRKVAKTFRHEARSLVGIRPQGESKSLWSTLNHPYWIVPSEDALALKRRLIYKRQPGISLEESRKSFADNLTPEWIQAGDVSVGDLVFLPIPREVNEHSELMEEGTAELLGWYAAEGCIGRRRRKDRTGNPWQDHLVVFTLGMGELHEVSNIVELCKKRDLSPKVIENYQGSNAVRIEITSQKLARLCREHVGKLATNKSLSPDILRMPKKWQTAFFTSYCSGDGCIRPEGSRGAGSRRISTASEKLASDIRLLAARLGLVASIIRCQQHHTTFGAGNPIFEVSIPAGQFGDVTSHSESFIWGEGGYLVCPVKEVLHDEAWQGPVFNFEVEEDNSYVAGGVAVHNSNVNGDLFPEKALIHAPPDWEKLSPKEMQEIGRNWDYGFPTFMGAYPYKHHQNKNPSRAFGRVDLAIWNPQMHRVELIVYLDRALCQKFDAYDIIERIERGEFPDVSMGAKVPHDVCTICEHKSKTTKDYCVHAATMMNKILPDGRKVAVRNDQPRFFDISFVFIGADKTAKVMSKLASKGNQVCMGDYCTIPRKSADVGAIYSQDHEDFSVGQEKTASEKVANDAIKKKVNVQDLEIWIEWPKGSTREYKDKKTGKVHYRRFMKADYGYIPGTKDADGEEIDVYVGPNKNAHTAYVIKQLKKSDGSFDENKVMIGYGSEKAARDSYDYHMGGTKEFFGGIHAVPLSAVNALFADNIPEEGPKEHKKTASHSCSCNGVCDPCSGSWDKLAVALFPEAQEKSASHAKLSEIIKSIPAGPFTQETLPKLENTERDIPNDVLDLMGGLPLEDSLSTPAMMGMVLKPREFQRVVLIRMGEPDFADELDKKQMTFGHTNDIDDSIPMGEEHVDSRLKELLTLLGLGRDRSIAAPTLRRRILIMISRGGEPVNKPELKTSKDPVMKKIAAAYNGYRRSLIKKATSIQQYMTTDPQLRADLFGSSMAEAFAGGIDKVASASAFSPNSLAYLMGAYTDRGIHLTKEAVMSLALTGAVQGAA